MRPRPRPAELVLLFFVVYCLVRVILGAKLSSLAPHAVPRGDVFITLLFVLTVKLALDYRALAWPAELESERRMHTLFLPGFLLAGGLPGAIVYAALPGYLPHLGHSGGALSGLLLFTYACVRAALAFVVPGAFFWLIVGLYIKRHGRFSVKGLVVQGAPGAIDILRDWLPPLALIYVYVALGPMLSQRLFDDRDALFARIDQFLFFGKNPTKLCEAIISPALSEWLSACYTFYVPLYPLVLGSLFAKRDRAPFREGAFALSLVLALGYIGYAMVPVVGPVFTQTFDRGLDLYYMAWLKEQLMDRTRIPRDCFPSLHTGASLTLLWAARHIPKLAWALSPIVISIPFACVYLRYHYVTDVLAGFLLFAAVATWASKSKALQAAFNR
jgi:membrane-associated phospholipid phosphatase